MSLLRLNLPVKGLDYLFRKTVFMCMNIYPMYVFIFVWDNFAKCLLAFASFCCEDEKEVDRRQRKATKQVEKDNFNVLKLNEVDI